MINGKWTVIIMLFFLFDPLDSFAGCRHLPSCFNVGDGYFTYFSPVPGWRQGALYPYYSWADSCWDGKGKKISSDIDAYGIVYRPIYQFTWPNKTLVLNLIIPQGQISMRNPSTRRRETSSGLGDIAFYPSFCIAISEKHRLGLYFDAPVTLPTGDYKKERIINMGTNQFSFEPIFGIYKGWCFDSKKLFFSELYFHYLINCENEAEHFKPGNMWQIQSTWGLAFGKSILGFAFRHYESVSKDEIFGHNAMNSEVKGTVLGPSISYQILPKCCFTVRVENTIDGENTAKMTSIKGKIYFMF
jgi:hypothetical protein